MALPASGSISWQQICTEFSLNPVTAVWPANFYGKGGAPASGTLGFASFYGRSGGTAFTPTPGTYTYTDNGLSGGGAGAGATISNTTSQTWTYTKGGTNAAQVTATLASGASGTSIRFELPALSGVNRIATVTLTVGANTWNLTLKANDPDAGGGGFTMTL